MNYSGDALRNEPGYLEDRKGFRQRIALAFVLYCLCTDRRKLLHQIWVRFKRLQSNKRPRDINSSRTRCIVSRNLRFSDVVGWDKHVWNNNDDGRVDAASSASSG